MIDAELRAAAAALLDAMRARQATLATAESCTGGLIAAALTDIAGASDVIDRGFVTYSNAAKTELLGVPARLIEDYGAVSEPVAHAMAEGALARANTTLAIAVTGIAGPGGGTRDKPVGTVWFGCGRKGAILTESHIFPGDRSEVRRATVLRAFALLTAALGPEQVSKA